MRHSKDSLEIFERVSYDVHTNVLAICFQDDGSIVV